MGAQRTASARIRLLLGGNMKLGSLVRYHYWDNNKLHGWGVVTEVNHVDPERPFFFVSWIVHENLYGKELRDTWYHPMRLEVICK
jgi:hypothetical protein